MKYFLIVLCTFMCYFADAQSTYKDAKKQKRHYEYIPKDYYTPLKLRINYVFVQDEKGGNNFDVQNPETDSLFQTLTNRMNYLISSLKPNPDESCYPFDDDLNDTKIRFVYSLQEVQHHKWWNLEEWGYLTKRSSLGLVSPAKNWKLQGIDDSLMVSLGYPIGINIYYTNSASHIDEILTTDTALAVKFGQHAISRFPAYNELYRSSQINMLNKYTVYLYHKYQATKVYNKKWHGKGGTKGWWLSTYPGLAHEIFHSLALGHSNEWHRSNKCRYSIMNQKPTERNWLPITEIGKMHFALTHSNVHQFVEEHSTYGVHLIIDKPVVWDDPLRRVYFDDIIIRKGGTLTIKKGQIIMPPNSTIQVKKKGKLIIGKDVVLKDAFGDQFKRIKRSWWWGGKVVYE